MPDFTPVHYYTPAGNPVIACGTDFMKVSYYSDSHGDVTCFACRKTEKFQEVGNPTPPVPLKEVIANDPLLRWYQRIASEKGGHRYRITVDVFCSSLEEAEQVAGERLGPDEDYGFEYQFNQHSVEEIPLTHPAPDNDVALHERTLNDIAEIVKQGLNSGSNDGEHEALTDLADALKLTYDEETDKYI